MTLSATREKCLAGLWSQARVLVTRNSLLRRSAASPPGVLAHTASGGGWRAGLFMATLGLSSLGTGVVDVSPGHKQLSN